jgi:serine O-acetyltransferase
VFDTVREDLDAVLERDPAAKSRLQVAVLYSGLHAIWAYRLTHRIHAAGMVFLARWLAQAARFLTGVEIHPAASIGRRFFIDHGMGVIIGETAVLGDDVLLYQGVTLGGTGNESGKRHPTLGDRVVVGAGAKVLGNIRIGSDTRVGANSVVLHDVPPHSTVVGIPGKVVRRRKGDENDVLSHQNLPDPTMDELVRLAARLHALEKRLPGGKKPAGKR